jgi:hypothetical protein
VDGNPEFGRVLGAAVVDAVDVRVDIALPQLAVHALGPLLVDDAGEPLERRAVGAGVVLPGGPFDVPGDGDQQQLLLVGLGVAPEPELHALQSRDHRREVRLREARRAGDERVGVGEQQRLRHRRERRLGEHLPVAVEQQHRVLGNALDGSLVDGHRLFAEHPCKHRPELLGLAPVREKERSLGAVVLREQPP